eukprot:scaffold870_cov393-Prasinococcus_capsulatus_cf.AAC.5
MATILVAVTLWPTLVRWVACPIADGTVWYGGQVPRVPEAILRNYNVGPVLEIVTERFLGAKCSGGDRHACGRRGGQHGEGFGQGLEGADMVLIPRPTLLGAGLASPFGRTGVASVFLRGLRTMGVPMLVLVVLSPPATSGVLAIVIISVLVNVESAQI